MTRFHKSVSALALAVLAFSTPLTAIAASDETAAGAEPAGDMEGTIMMQSDRTVLAGDLIGATVYNLDKDPIGDINDMIVTLDGKVEGVVIGVGGFLGIGEKKVAVELTSINLDTEDAAAPRLYLNVSKAELEAATEFVSAQRQHQEEELRKAQEAAEESTEKALENGATQD